MRVEVIVCDRCGERVESEYSTLRITRGDSARVRELCSLCIHDFDVFLRAPVQEPEVKVKETEFSVRAREMANIALEEWAVGAHPNMLVQTLRDISSAARR